MNPEKSYMYCRVHLIRNGADYGIGKETITSSMGMLLSRQGNYTLRIGGGASDDIFGKNLVASHATCRFAEQHLVIDAEGNCEVTGRGSLGRTETKLGPQQEIQIPLDAYDPGLDWEIVFPDRTVVRGKIRREREILPKGCAEYLSAQHGEIEKIQESTSAVIYKCQDDKILKVFRPSLSATPKSLLRFLNAARKFQQLHTPLFLKIRGIVYKRALNLAYVVTNYFDGEPLNNYVARKGTLPEEEALSIARGIAERLSVLQRHKTCLRNLAPENILVAKDGQICITGFFLVKTEAHLTGEHTQMIRAGYTSPEQIGDPANADIQSDVFSLGAILYGMLVGEPPLRAETPYEYVEKIRNTPPPTASAIKEVAPHISPRVCEAIAAMLGENPKDRPRPDKLVSLLSSGKEAAHAKVRVNPRKKTGIEVTATGTVDLEARGAIGAKEMAKISKTLKDGEKELTEDSIGFIDELKIEGTSNAGEPERAPKPAGRASPVYRAFRVGFWRRFVASILDSILAALMASGLAYLLCMLFLSAGQLLEAAAFLFLGAFLGFVFYYSSEGFLGASPGKSIMGLKIGHQDGSPASHDLYMKRYLIKSSQFWMMLFATAIGMGDSMLVVTSVSLWGLVLFIGAFWIFSEKKQCLWDMLSETAVFRREELSAPSMLTCSMCGVSFKLGKSPKMIVTCPDCKQKVRLIQFYHQRGLGTLSTIVGVVLLLLTVSAVYQAKKLVTDVKKESGRWMSKKESEIESAWESILSETKTGKVATATKEGEKQAPAVGPSLASSEERAYRNLTEISPVDYRGHIKKIKDCDDFLLRYPSSSHRPAVVGVRSQSQESVEKAARPLFLEISSALERGDALEAWRKLDTFPVEMRTFKPDAGQGHQEILEDFETRIKQDVAGLLAAEIQRSTRALAILEIPKTTLAQQWEKQPRFLNMCRRDENISRLLADSASLYEKMLSKIEEVEGRHREFCAEYRQRMRDREYDVARSTLDQYDGQMSDMGLTAEHKYRNLVAVLRMEQECLGDLFSAAARGAKKMHSYTVCNDRTGKTFKGKIENCENGNVYFKTLTGETVSCPLQSLVPEDVERFAGPDSGPRINLALAALYYYDGSDKAAKYLEKTNGKIQYGEIFAELYSKH